MKKTAFLTLILTFVLFAFQSNAYATFLWDWNLNATDYYANVGDTIYFTATIYNNSTAGEVIDKESFYSSWGYATSSWGGLNLNDYQITIANYFLNGGTLAAGESIDLPYAWWLIGTNPDGDYDNAYFTLNLINDYPDGDINDHRPRYFTVHIGNSGGPTIPEPASIMLLSLGLGGVFFRRRFI